MTSFSQLADTLNGRVFTPEHDGYDQARAVWNGTVDIAPAAIARCRNTEDVVQAVNYAVHRGLDASVRAGGHNVAGTALVEDGLVIDVSQMRGVRVDTDRGVAHVQGGALLADVDQATYEHGLVTPSGFISDTGIGGLALRGGMGHTMRKFGLTCDNIVGAELVTSDGTVRRVTEEDTDLMWALRGGPLDLGVVTEFEFRLHPIEPKVRLILSAYPAETGAEVNRFMADLMDRAPRELGLVSFYTTFGDEAELPEAIRGRDCLAIYGLYSGSREEANEVIAPLINHSEALVDMGDWMDYPDAQSFLDGSYPDGMRYYWTSMFLDELTDDALEIIDDYGHRRPTPKTTLDIWTMGGAIEDFSPDSSAFPGRYAKYMVAIEANWHDSSDDETCMKWAREVCERLQPYASDKLYLNFPGTRQEKNRAVEQLEASVLDRLHGVRDEVDPHGLFQDSSQL